MTDLQNDPAIIKLVAYAKKKKTVTYEEVNDFLPDEIANSDRIEEVTLETISRRVARRPAV